MKITIISAEPEVIRYRRRTSNRQIAVEVAMDDGFAELTPESAARTVLSVTVGLLMLMCILCQLLSATFAYADVSDADNTKRKPRRRTLRQRNSDVDVALQLLRESARG